jgi:hypothetical protein
VTTFPDFTANGVKTLLQLLDSLSDKVDKILTDLSNINEIVEDKESEARNYEREYRNKVKEKYGYINLFGANTLSREYKRYELSIAYVDMEAAISNLESRVILSSEILKSSDVVWVAGEAGSGKTTLLQWLAVNSATDAMCEIKEIAGNLPIFMELRSIDYSNLGIKQVVDLLMRNSSYNMPSGWAEKIFLSGDVLLLVDGLDEISLTNRSKVLNWLEELYKKYKIRIVITARPNIRDRLRLRTLEVKILPMNSSKVEKFIEYWHKAILLERFMENEEDVSCIAKKTWEKIQVNEAIYTLTTNPLLCAMICSLHYKNGCVLPSDKKELYEDCCKMLIDNRDNEKELFLDIRKPSYDEKKIILGQMAYWMLKNGNVVIKKKEAIECVERSISSMRLGLDVSLSANSVFEYLLERSGVLREPQVGKIDFIHKTFQEFLAAYEISRQADFIHLAKNVVDDSWYETIIIGIGFANKEYASQMIKIILDLGKSDLNEKKYLFIATACASNAIELELNLRKKIEERVKQLIPPALSESKRLAEANGFVVPFLKNSSTYHDEEKVACIRTLRYIGTPLALRASLSYLNTELHKFSLIEISKLFKCFTMKELKACDIEELVFNYIIKTFNGSLLELPEIFIKIIENIDSVKKKRLMRLKIKSLAIYDYENLVSSNILKIFTEVDNLIVYGSFIDLNIMNSIKKLKHSEFRSDNYRFSIYSLKKYSCLYGVETFKIDIPREEFVNGEDLGFLYEVKDMELKLVNKYIEFSLEEFEKFPKLQKLSIDAEYGAEFNYNCLSKNNSLKELHIKIPDDTMHSLIFDLCLPERINVYVNKISMEGFGVDQETIDLDEEYI